MGNTHVAGAGVDLTLRVNECTRRLHLDSRVTLLDALREDLGLTGTKKGCDQGACGARGSSGVGPTVVEQGTAGECRDGTAYVRSAATDLGTGTYTIATQVTL